MILLLVIQSKGIFTTELVVPRNYSDENSYIVHTHYFKAFSHLKDHTKLSQQPTSHNEVNLSS